MDNRQELYYSPLTDNFLVEYRGDFLNEINNITYAVGNTITETLAVISIFPEDRNRILKDVPSIIYIDFRVMFVLQDIAPNYVDNINNLKINPYLNLTGLGITVGIIDTGIDYLNKNFINEDGTSRILKIWDQSIQGDNKSNMYIGNVYTNEEINAAIKSYNNNEDPYLIVPSKDERGHGTKVANIIGGRGQDKNINGIASNCNFIIVKLIESSSFKKNLIENGINDVAVYDTSEVVSGIEYLKQEFYKLKTKAMVIHLGIGATEGSHDGSNLISRYLNSLGSIRGICLVSGVGNQGAAQGHTTGFIKAGGSSSIKELNVPKEMKELTFSIWLKKPNKASINIISPSGESSNIIKTKVNKFEKFKYVFTETEIQVYFRSPDFFTGLDVITVNFHNIKPGIWKIQLIGEYIISGQYDIWLPPKEVIPEDLNFLESNSLNTITLPATASNVIKVAYYGSNGEYIAQSGMGVGYNLGEINPDIITSGINILTSKVGGGSSTFSGSCAASAIVAGACALLLQWGIVNENDTTMYSNKIRSYLIYGANRNKLYKYPSESSGYGELNILGTFNIIARIYSKANNRFSKKNTVNEYYVGRLYIRMPTARLEEF